MTVAKESNISKSALVDEKNLNLFVCCDCCREILNEYTMKLQVMTEVLLKAMARSLNLEENSFLDMFGEQLQALIIARFNFYPPCPRPDMVIGCKPHADGTVLSILLQDKEVEGLQVQKDNQWYRVPVIPEALVINIGDQGEVTMFIVLDLACFVVL